MRLAILVNNKDLLLEYKEEDVKKKLKDLLTRYSFDESWDILCKALKMETHKI